MAPATRNISGRLPRSASVYSKDDHNVNLLPRKRKPEEHNIDESRPTKKVAKSFFLDKEAIAAVVKDVMNRKPVILITLKEQKLSNRVLR